MKNENGYNTHSRQRKHGISRHYHVNIISASAGSSVVVGSSNTTTSANNGAAVLSEMESELLRVFRGLDMRRKNAMLAHAFSVEDQMKEVSTNG